MILENINPIIIYKHVQTIGNINPGGVIVGLIHLYHSEFTEDDVYAEDISMVIKTAKNPNK